MNHLKIFFIFFIFSFHSLLSYSESKPNFIIIMADDCTYSDLEVYGGQAKTPHLNKLAREGMKFNRCFQSTAMCAPTRQSLLTGIYPVRNGAFANHSATKKGLKSIIHHLEPGGYKMALTGKRHIGPESVYPFRYSDNKDDPDMKFIDSFITESKKEKKPFCLFAMSSSPHVPWTYGDPTKYPTEKIKLPPYLVDTKDTREAFSKYFAEISYFDDQVGQIVELIDDHKLKENTVIIVLSEHGSLFPFEKWTCYDAGLRSGLLVRYPGIIKQESITNVMVEYVDIVPTILDLANTKPLIKLDGQSFKDVLFGKTDKHKDYVFGVQTTNGINHGTQPYAIRSIRNDSLKLILNLFPENSFTNALLIDPKGWSPAQVPYLWWMNSWREAASKSELAFMILERYQKRPAIEFYNIKNDPYELVNLAFDPKYKNEMDFLSIKLKEWMQLQGDEGRKTELMIKIR